MQVWFHYDVTTALERFHLYVIRMYAILISDFEDPTEQQSIEKFFFFL